MKRNIAFAKSSGNIYVLALPIILATLALLITLLAVLTGPAYAAAAFPDVPQSHWASAYVDRLTTMGAINGMPDGSFAPGRNITRGEFVKIVVSTTIGNQEAASEGHWATAYMNTAEEKGLLQPDEFAPDTWDTPIIRQDMAKVVARAMEFVLKEQPLADTSAYTAKITDWATTCEVCKPYIAQAYGKGIITGYTDGSFGGAKQATRAEAAAMIVRLIDPAYRVQSSGGAISFNPLTDVAADGRMKLAKAEEYMMLTLQSLTFYKDGSKYYVKGDLPELPEGFENWLRIEIQYKSSSGLPVYLCTTHIIKVGDKLPKVGDFQQEIAGMTSATYVDSVNVKLGVEALNSTSEGYQKHEGFWTMSSLEKDKLSLIDVTNYDKQTNKYYDFSKLFTW